MSGAGISVSAGIPDFRSPNTGIYDNLKEYDLPYPEAIFELAYFRKNPQAYYSFVHHCAQRDCFDLATPAHWFVRYLCNERKILHSYFTQNVDDLEGKAGMDMDKVIHAHGTVRRAHCSVCYTNVSGK